MIRAAVATIALALGSAAMADEAPPPPVRTEPPIVGFVDSAEPFCYAREYDAAHMKAHPKQKVTAIALSYLPEKTFKDVPDPQKMWDQYADEPAFSAIVAVTLSNKEGMALGGVYCRTGSSKELECGVEGDGGTFTVLLQDDGRVKLVNDKGGFTISDPEAGPETEGSEHYPIDPKDDHAAFILSATKGGLCDADW